MIQVNIILGSTRKSSLGRRLFKNLLYQAQEIENKIDVKFSFIDISNYNLPFFYEDIPPINNKIRHLSDNEQLWVNDMKNSDGSLFLTPEYNHSIPATLKNALDFLSFEGKNKPAKIMTYSPSNRGGQLAFLLSYQSFVNSAFIPDQHLLL